MRNLIIVLGLGLIVLGLGLIVLGLGLILNGCTKTEKQGIYTLYRTSVIIESARIHVASFDSKDGEKYNNEECFHAADLYQQQPGVIFKFWCEKGPYKE